MGFQVNARRMALLANKIAIEKASANHKATSKYRFDPVNSI